MRKMTANVMIAAVTVLWSGSGVFGQQAPGNKDKPKDSPPAAAPAQPKAKQAEKTATPSLEEMLTRALKDNPDIRVAEAKVREADAELNRARLLVTQKVIAFHRALEAQKAVVDLAEKEFTRFQDLARQNSISRELLDERQQKLAAAKAKLAEVEAEMPYLLGKQPQPVTGYFRDFGWPVRPLDANSQSFWIEQPYSINDYRGTLFRPLNLNSYSIKTWDLAAPTPPAQPPAPGSMAEKIRKALDARVTIHFVQQPLADVLREIERIAPGVSFRAADLKDRPIASLPVSDFHIQELPAGAVLQALEDTFPGLVFVVRDYGILVTWNEKLPPGALRVEAFWKAGKEKPKGGDGDSSRKNPPWEDVRGTVLDVDAQSGLVSISLGKDAGLQVGNTLEVYRLEPKPEYLGTIRLVEVQAKRAVGRPVAPAPGKKIQKGDRVASRINAP